MANAQVPSKPMHVAKLDAKMPVDRYEELGLYRLPSNEQLSCLGVEGLVLYGSLVPSGMKPTNLGEDTHTMIPIIHSGKGRRAFSYYKLARQLQSPGTLTESTAATQLSGLPPLQDAMISRCVLHEEAPEDVFAVAGLLARLEPLNLYSEGAEMYRIVFLEGEAVKLMQRFDQPMMVYGIQQLDCKTFVLHLVAEGNPKPEAALKLHCLAYTASFTDIMETPNSEVSNNINPTDAYSEQQGPTTAKPADQYAPDPPSPKAKVRCIDQGDGLPASPSLAHRLQQVDSSSSRAFSADHAMSTSRPPAAAAAVEDDKWLDVVLGKRLKPGISSSLAAEKALQRNSRIPLRPGALKGAAAHHLPSGVPGTLLKVPEVVDIKQDGVESAEARFATPSSGLKAERSKGSTLTEKVVQQLGLDNLNKPACAKSLIASGTQLDMGQ